MGQSRALRPWTWAQPVMPGDGVEAAALLGAVAVDVGERQRARADQAHVAAHDVPQLRELVEAGGAQEPAEPWEALVVGQQFAVGAAGVGHAAELDDLDRLSVAAGARLAEQHRRPEADPHRDGRRRDDRRSDHERRPSDRHVDGTLHRGVQPSGGGHRAERRWSGNVSPVTAPTRLVIVGAGGFGREVHDVVDALNAGGTAVELVGYVDDADASDELLARLGTSRLGGIDVLTDDDRDSRLGNDVGYRDRHRCR